MVSSRLGYSIFNNIRIQLWMNYDLNMEWKTWSASESDFEMFIYIICKMLVHKMVLIKYELFINLNCKLSLCIGNCAMPCHLESEDWFLNISFCPYLSDWRHNMPNQLLTYDWLYLVIFLCVTLRPALRLGYCVAVVSW